MVEATTNVDAMSEKRSGALSVHRITNLIRAGVETLRSPDTTSREADLLLTLSPRGLTFSGEDFYPPLTLSLADEDALLGAIEDFSGQHIELEIEGDAGLDLDFRVPNGPLPELNLMIEEEIKYRSPFNSDEAQWFWTASETANGDWAVRAVVVLKTILDPVKRVFTDTGLKPFRVRRRFGRESYLTTADWLWKDSDLAKPKSALNRVPLSFILLAGAVGVFAISAVTQVFSQRGQISELTQSATEARSAIGDVAQSRAAEEAFTNLRTTSYTSLSMVGQVTNMLPDGYWLDQLVIEDGELTITGFGPSAAEVSRLLASLPEVGDVRFASPVTRDNSQNIERFRISGTLAGAGQ